MLIHTWHVNVGEMASIVALSMVAGAALLYTAAWARGRRARKRGRYAGQ